ncbi:MAG: hypothetical protein NTY37_13280 [Methanothrix sp.]|nr:hypothetical protein [Methanothrix sp.]
MKGNIAVLLIAGIAMLMATGIAQYDPNQYPEEQFQGDQNNSTRGDQNNSARILCDNTDYGRGVGPCPETPEVLITPIPNTQEVPITPPSTPPEVSHDTVNKDTVDGLYDEWQDCADGSSQQPDPAQVAKEKQRFLEKVRIYNEQHPEAPYTLEPASYPPTAPWDGTLNP